MVRPVIGKRDQLHLSHSPSDCQGLAKLHSASLVRRPNSIGWITRATCPIPGFTTTGPRLGGLDFEHEHIPIFYIGNRNKVVGFRGELAAIAFPLSRSEWNPLDWSSSSSRHCERVDRGPPEPPRETQPPGCAVSQRKGRAMRRSGDSSRSRRAGTPNRPASRIRCSFTSASPRASDEPPRFGSFAAGPEDREHRGPNFKNRAGSGIVSLIELIIVSLITIGRVTNDGSRGSSLHVADESVAYRS